MAGASVLVCAASVAFNLLCARRVRAVVEDLTARMESAERTVADASGVALAAADSMRFDSSPDVSTDRNDFEVLGFGQTKTTRSRLVYVDTRKNGVVSREYIGQFPLD